MPEAALTAPPVGTPATIPVPLPGGRKVLAIQLLARPWWFEARDGKHVSYWRVAGDGRPVDATAEARSWFEAQRGQVARMFAAKDRTDDGARIAPTRQTADRLRPDVLKRLHANGRLTDAQLAASRDLDELYNALVACQEIRASWPDRTSGFGAGRSGSRRVGIERLNEHQQWLYRRAYRPWANEMGRVPWLLRSTPSQRLYANMSVAEITLAIVVEGLTLSEVIARAGIGRKLGMPTLVAVLVKGLDRFAELVGR